MKIYCLFTLRPEEEQKDLAPTIDMSHDVDRDLWVADFERAQDTLDPAYTFYAEDL